MIAHTFIPPETLYLFPRLLPHINQFLCCQLSGIGMPGSSPLLCHLHSCFFVTQILISALLFLLSFPVVVQSVNKASLCYLKVKINDPLTSLMENQHVLITPEQTQNGFSFLVNADKCCLVSLIYERDSNLLLLLLLL